MKRGIWCTGILVLWAAVSDAQTKKSKSAPANNKAVAQQTIQQQKKVGSYNITSWGQYGAKNGAPATATTLSISDPTIRTLNQRAAGAPIEMNGKDIMGVPKIVYGLGNGQILFRSRGATTSGTSTGSGTVGTGSSLGPIGMNGLTLGVNGKSPYAGPIMDGIIVTDMNDRRVPATKQDRNRQIRKAQ